jgi:hypothetical protein
LIAELLAKPRAGQFDSRLKSRISNQVEARREGWHGQDTVVVVVGQLWGDWEGVPSRLLLLTRRFVNGHESQSSRSVAPTACTFEKLHSAAYAFPSRHPSPDARLRDIPRNTPRKNLPSCPTADTPPCPNPASNQHESFAATRICRTALGLEPTVHASCSHIVVVLGTRVCEATGVVLEGALLKESYCLRCSMPACGLVLKTHPLAQAPLPLRPLRAQIGPNRSRLPPRSLPPSPRAPDGHVRRVCRLAVAGSRIQGAGPPSAGLPEHAAFRHTFPPAPAQAEVGIAHRDWACSLHSSLFPFATDPTPQCTKVSCPPYSAVSRVPC